MHKLIKPLLFICLLYRNIAAAQETQSQESLPQEARHEFYAGYGFISVPVIVNAVGDVIGGIFMPGGDKKVVVGPVMAGYTFFASPKVGLGVEAGYTSFTSRYGDTGALDYRNNFYVFMPHATYYWARVRGADFYSGAKAGACYFRRYPFDNRQDDSSFVPAFHITAIGVRVGKKLGFYMDSGFGYDGLMNAGLNMRF